MRRSLTVSLFLASIGILIATGGAGAHGTTVQRLDLSSRAKVDSYLRSLGVDPRTVVVQRGARNYAGPRCPGRGWSCTTARRVVQIAASRGGNTFECTGAAADSGPACVIVQTGSSADNVARCVERSTAPGAAQSCTITQTNVSGANSAYVEQTLVQNDGSSQAGSQSAAVKQTNESGANAVQVIDAVTQLTIANGQPTGLAVAQTQQSNQTVGVDQTTTSGTNASDVSESLSQTEHALHGPSISQQQNTAGSGPNLLATIAQHSATGANSSKLSQVLGQLAKAQNSAGAVSQTQGSSAGGLTGHVHQASAGLSTSDNSQTESQQFFTVNTGPLAQTQIGPSDCCSNQSGNAGDTLTLHQMSTQLASPGANQLDQLNGHCTSSGMCDLSQSTTENGQTTTNSCTSTGSGCVITTSCAEGQCQAITPPSFPSGEVFASVGDGKVNEYQPNGTFVRTLDTGLGGFTTGSVVGPDRNLYVTDFSGQAVSVFDPTGALVGTFGSGYDSDPESIRFDSLGDAYVGQADGSHMVLKFSAAGAPLGSFSPTIENRGTDWIDLAPDDCTLSYTSEGTSVKRFDVCTSTQLADFATGLPATAYAIRLLPDGGALVADTTAIVRLDASGSVVQRYGDDSHSYWFSLDLAPDGTTFWAGDVTSGDVVRFSLADGTELTTIATGATNMLFGLSVAP